MQKMPPEYLAWFKTRQVQLMKKNPSLHHSDIEILLKREWDAAKKSFPSVRCCACQDHATRAEIVRVADYLGPCRCTEPHGSKKA